MKLILSNPKLIISLGLRLIEHTYKSQAAGIVRRRKEQGMKLYDCTIFFNKFSRGHPDFKGSVKNARERNKNAPHTLSKKSITAR